jgi:hypothetical protein
MSINQLKQLTVEDASLILRCESIRSNSFQSYGLDEVSVQTISQLTNFTTPIDCGVNPGARVLILTRLGTVNSNLYISFKLINSNIKTTSVIKTSVLAYGGTYGLSGLPISVVQNIVNGECDIGIINVGNTQASSVYRIYVEIIQSV